MRFLPDVPENSPSLLSHPRQPLAALLPPPHQAVGTAPPRAGHRPQLRPAPRMRVPGRPFLSAAGHVDGAAVALRTQPCAAAAGTGSEAGSPPEEKIVLSP